mmetsp:Transcript_6551/g.15913  ORF Transcript_6551/g.15913 Transcript_6551/m.15913 type:complete len:94 (-) Transcript_6551:166-447(-)
MARSVPKGNPALPPKETPALTKNVSYLVPDSFISSHFNSSHPMVKSMIAFRNRKNVRCVVFGSCGEYGNEGGQQALAFERTGPDWGQGSMFAC